MDAGMNPNISPAETLTRMVAQYEVSLLRTCYMILRDQSLAEDATQETFLKAYKALPTFRGDCSEKTWLMRIAMNTCRDMRRSAWFRHVDRKVTPDRLPEPSRNIDPDREEDLAQAILSLPIKYREVILLRFYQDMTMREIAAVLNIAVSTVGKRIHQACTKLEGMLRKEDVYEYGNHA